MKECVVKFPWSCYECFFTCTRLHMHALKHMGDGHSLTTFQQVVSICPCMLPCRERKGRCRLKSNEHKYAWMEETNSISVCFHPHFVPSSICIVSLLWPSFHLQLLKEKHDNTVLIAETVQQKKLLRKYNRGKLIWSSILHPLIIMYGKQIMALLFYSNHTDTTVSQSMHLC